VALEWLSELGDGRLAYRVKAPRGRATHRILDPFELLARLCALIPPPKHAPVRYHGVLAPSSPYRKAVVPRPPAALAKCPVMARGMEDVAASGRTEGTRVRAVAGSPGGHRARRERRSAASVATPALKAPGIAQADTARGVLAALQRPDAPQPEVDGIAPNVVSVRHWSRLLDGALLATSPRIDWATLLRRTYNVDVMVCAKCGGRLRVMAVVTDKAVASELWRKLDAPRPPARRARSSTRAPPVQLPLPGLTA
jgi:hypothetical protein